MIRSISLLVALIVVSSLAQGNTTLALGRAISQIDDVQIEETPEERCPPESICLRSWARWTLDIKRTLSGSKVKGRVRVVMMQHAPMADSLFKKELLFVLEHIDDPKERRRLHADYKLLEFTYPIYCTESDPAQWGVSPEEIDRQDIEGNVSYCFPASSAMKEKR